MKQLIKPVLKSLGFIALYTIINTIIVLAYSIVAGIEDIQNMSPNAITTMLIATQILVLFIILLIYKKQFTTFVRLKRVSPKIILWSFIIGIAGINISALLITVMNFLIPEQVASYIEAIEGSIGGASFLFSLIAVVILAPLVEEIMMRGMVFKWFEKTNIKPWVLIIVSGLFFGIFHLNLIQGVFTTVVGMIYALGFLMTRSLWVPIVMHAANNLYAFTAGYLPEGLIESQWFTIISYLMLVLIPIGFYQIKKELRGQI